jgi:hypothetical protein
MLRHSAASDVAGARQMRSRKMRRACSCSFGAARAGWRPTLNRMQNWVNGELGPPEQAHTMIWGCHAGAAGGAVGLGGDCRPGPLLQVYSKLVPYGKA